MGRYKFSKDDTRNAYQRNGCADAARCLRADAVSFQSTRFCRYEPIEKRIETARVLVVDNLLRNEDDISDVARKEWGRSAASRLKREREIAGFALNNILNNIGRLVRHPEMQVAHVSEVPCRRKVSAAGDCVKRHADRFRFYHADILKNFADFVQQTQTPVLGICGGHQLVGLSFGARVVTLDNLEQSERRESA
jgi:cobyric acid synthase